MEALGVQGYSPGFEGAGTFAETGAPETLGMIDARGTLEPTAETGAPMTLGLGLTAMEAAEEAGPVRYVSDLVHMLREYYCLP